MQIQTSTRINHRSWIWCKDYWNRQ